MLIMPRLILTAFGSGYNGVSEAITQFLRVIVLFQAGIGGVARAALYRPLAEKDSERVSVIVKTTQGFMRKVVLIFTGIALVLACTYPLLVLGEFDWFFTFSLVLIMSASTFAQIFIGQTYQLLIMADQNHGLIFIVNSVKIAASTAVAAIMINMGVDDIRGVKLGSSAVFALAPLFVYIYAKRKYRLVPGVKKDNSFIKQRWDNFGQQIAGFVSVNTALIILSIFTNVFEVSVYAVYNLVTSGVFAFLVPINKGTEAAFGNMVAKGEHDLIKRNLRVCEQVIFSAATFLFAVCAVMAMPFIMLYTKNVTDADYHRPLFLYVMVAAGFFRGAVSPYQVIVNAAGHFRQMRNPAIFEAALNITVSVILVQKFGIIGAAAGSLIAFMYRAARFAVYASRVIARRSLFLFARRIILSLACLIAAPAAASALPLREVSSFACWTLNAFIVSSLVFLMVAAVEVLFYKSDLIVLLKMVKGILKKNVL
jgi:O-antigen/teichoic acid export membrane protein